MMNKWMGINHPLINGCEENIAKAGNEQESLALVF
jgi:hypothetical protein